MTERRNNARSRSTASRKATTAAKKASPKKRWSQRVTQESDALDLKRGAQIREAEPLKLACPTWYADHEIALHIGERATAIDRASRVVISSTGREIDYDAVVLATGSSPFVPTVPGVDKKGVFVYRTIEDLEGILAYAEKASSAAVGRP